MKRTRVWVSPNGGDWVVKVEGQTLPLSRFRTKADAVEYGARTARGLAPSQLLIQRADGTIEDERTYGDDPFPPRG